MSRVERRNFRRVLLAGMAAGLLMVGFMAGSAHGEQNVLENVPVCPSFYGRGSTGDFLPLCVYEGFEPQYHEWGRWLITYGKVSATVNS